MVTMKLCLGALVFGISSFCLSARAVKVDSEVGFTPLRSPEAQLPRSRITGGLTANGANDLKIDVSLASAVESPKQPTLSRPKLIKRGKKQWTNEEEQRLLDLKGQDLPWSEILKHFPGRSYISLNHKYQRLTRPVSTIPPKKRGRLWTEEESNYLLELAEQGVPIKELMEIFEGRSEQAIRSKYRYLTKGWTVPEALLKPFTAEEDELLLEVAELDGTWEEKAEFFENRNGNALSHRYVRIVTEGREFRPRWTLEEEELLIEGIDSGLTWEELCELTGRSDDSVKNRVRSLLDEERVDLAPQIAPGRRYRTIDFELMQEMLDKGMAWENLAKYYFPGRSANSMRMQFRKYKLNKMAHEWGDEES